MASGDAVLPLRTPKVRGWLGDGLIGRIGMTERQQKAEPSKEEIRKKADEWLSKGGQDQLIQALRKAGRDSQTLRDEARVETNVLNEPVTV